LPSLLRATVWAVSHELICAVSSLHKHALLIFSISFLASTGEVSVPSVQLLKSDTNLWLSQWENCCNML
jgi:hypothetical protein